MAWKHCKLQWCKAYRTPSFLSFLLFVFHPSSMTPPHLLTPRLCVGLALQSVCEWEREKKWEGKDRERWGPWTWGVLYMWREGSLMEEVASHKSQLMSVTLIRSPIHQRKQGPIHPRLFRTWGPQEPWANSHPLTLMLRCVTLWKHPTQMSGRVPRCLHAHTLTPTRTHVKPESRNRLFFLIWLIINSPWSLSIFLRNISQ